MDNEQKIDEIIKSAITLFSNTGAATLDPNRPFTKESHTLFGDLGTFEISPGFRLRDAFDLLIAIKACNRLMSDENMTSKDRHTYSCIYADLMGGKPPKSGINILHILEKDNTFAIDVLTATHDVFALYAASVINHPSQKESS